MLAGIAAAFIVSALACGWIAHRRHAQWLDQPGERSLHSVPVPRLGGVGIWPAIAAGLLLALPAGHGLVSLPSGLGALLLCGLALLDDRHGLGPVPRLLGQLLASALVVYGLGLAILPVGLPLLSSGLTLVAVIWGINLYNFMDGMDGFAGGMALIGFATLGLLGGMAGDTGFMAILLVLAAGHAGFLLLNFPPARLFMGDCGSTVAGFAMVVSSLWGWQQGLFAFWIPLLVFSPFWVDASITLVRRIVRGERFWEAHRSHYYQRWVLAGYSHRQVVLWQYALMGACSGLALAWQRWGTGYNEIVPVLAVAGFYCGLGIWSDRFLARR